MLSALVFADVGQLGPGACSDTFLPSACEFCRHILESIVYGGPLVQFSRFAPRPISSSSFRLFSPASSLLPLSPPAFTFSPSFFHFLPQLFSLSPPAFFKLFFTFSPSFLSRPRFRGAPSIIWINYAHALESAIDNRPPSNIGRACVTTKKAKRTASER